jgi:hypothetical protein
MMAEKLNGGLQPAVHKFDGLAARVALALHKPRCAQQN